MKNTCERVEMKTNNSYQTVDHSADSFKFTLAGSNHTVEVYDSVTN